MAGNSKKFVYVCWATHRHVCSRPLSGRTVFLSRSALVCANPTEIYPKSALLPKLDVSRYLRGPPTMPTDAQVASFSRR